jgi:hypothetical protein
MALIPENRDAKLDTIHAMILVIGLLVVFDRATLATLNVFAILTLLLVWTAGYWALVKFILPQKWSGQ